ncbi:MAG: RNA polymerase sigma factor [Candidatus Omnitrophica bacterium]|nr:RNA polymerase sigma factor [Candidatus Omnitrophota bacterium]
MKEISKELLTEAASGNMEAFQEVYKALAGYVYTVALKVTQNRADAEEVTQDVFITVYKNLNTFAFKASFKTWVYRITMNMAINKYRVTARNKTRHVDLDSAPDAACGASTVTQHLEEEETKNRLDVLLAKLSPEMRSCIILREIEGMDYKEIAGTLKIPLNTVRSRLKRSREALMAAAYGEAASGAPSTGRQVINNEVR